MTTRNLGHLGEDAIVAAKSIVKTELLRKDRLTDSQVKQRLAVCLACPGGHVVLDKKGQVKSCGPLLGRNRNQSKSPCGCLLRKKARDRLQECPFDYWPDIGGTPRLQKLDISPKESKSCGKKRMGTPVMEPDLQPKSSLDGKQPHEAAAVDEVFGESDWLTEVTPTGRKRRVLDVAARKERVRYRRERIAKAKETAGDGGVPLYSDLQEAYSEPGVGASLTADNAKFLYEFFDRVVVVNLDRRQDRMERFRRHLAHIGWPFKPVERVRAIDGLKVRPPGWFHAGGGAWGCMMSHLRIIEDAMMDDVQSLLVLEDDVYFGNDFRNQVARFLRKVPKDWQQIYLGGQHLKQRKQPPQAINDEVVAPYNVNRTHAYALHKRGLSQTYRWLTDFKTHAQNSGHHIDHRLGVLHGNTSFKVYAPVRWLAGQYESVSNIKGQRMPSRIWNGHRVENQTIPFVAVIGLHRSGSSCLAGVLHKLGIHMGQQLGGYESTGGFESAALARICEQAFPFPATRCSVANWKIKKRLTTYVWETSQQAKAKGTLPGGKYPHLCAMAPLLKDICGGGLRVININRPLEDSITSLKGRSRKSGGWLAITDDQAEDVQRWLWAQKNKFLTHNEHLNIEYYDLLNDPETVVQKIVDYLQLTPTDTAKELAIQHVKQDQQNYGPLVRENEN